MDKTMYMQELDYQMKILKNAYENKDYDLLVEVSDKISKLAYVLKIINNIQSKAMKNYIDREQK